MADINVTHLGRTFFLEESDYSLGKNDSYNNRHSWHPRPEFEEVVKQFIRNKVVIKYVTANFDHSEEDILDVQDMLQECQDLCDSVATGFWTWRKWYRRNRQYDHVGTTPSIPLDTGEGRIYLFFENEQDLKTFLDKCDFLKALQ